MGKWFFVYVVPALAILIGLAVIGSAGYLVKLEWTAPPEPPPQVIEQVNIPPDLPPAAKAAAVQRQLDTLQREVSENKARTEARAARQSRLHNAQAALQISLALMFVMLSLMSYQRARARRSAMATLP